ncbi:TPA: trypsin-like peptidase domain-containing protein [Klebsiella pneumoniae]|nr:trypsin-like peptidase domain-containing protein [Klebsiella pneumoniae]
MNITDKNGLLYSLNPSSARGIVNGQRYPVPDATIAPFNSIVQIPVNNGSVAAATGIVIGRNTILTSAHVADDMSIGEMVTPGMNETSPYGAFRVVSLQIPDEWATTKANTYDYALVIVAPNEEGKHIGDVVPQLSIKKITIDDLQVGSSVLVIGYPGDKGSQQMWASPGVLLREDGNYYCLNSLLGWEPRLLAFDCDAEHGNSGGPVLTDNNEIIGVVDLMSSNVAAFCNGESGGNGAPMMDEIAVNWIQSRIQ